MTPPTNDVTHDNWSKWILSLRHGDDRAHEDSVRVEITRYADRVLDFVRLRSGMTLADIGTGDGLVGFRAIERAGASIRVVMTDISAPLLRHTQQTAGTLGVSGQCTYIHGSAENLAGIADEAVDAATMRAVLAYVEDKPAAMRELYRILKPGGRFAIAEPILRDEALEVCMLKRLVDTRAIQTDDPFFPLLLRCRAAQFPDTEEKARTLPITNYGERDLVRFAIDAGFTDIHLELHIDVRTEDCLRWETFVRTSPHPLAPTLEEIFDKQFTRDEREYLEGRMRAIFESGKQLGAARIAYLTAKKP
ncbi:arsenite methyltransferase [Paraburkholderia sp. WC7.3g]|uniref:Methyltransferase domain-containing protein n=1 Tax=Paraburkholderia podalyriae TaxID=1938811 RepID=A0ABR7PJQ3_9BURK|nr:methyltransferase domain-containing protein [Paraburkholderia podalyriae]MBC8746600.1 methyltransferase domain-containing protein [Paraburkholderia podalyriae]